MKKQFVTKCVAIVSALFLCVSSGVTLNAMEAIIAEEAAGLGVRLEEGASSALARSMSEEIGTLDKAVIEGMSSELKSTLRSEIQASLKNISSSLEKKGLSATEAASFGKNAGAEFKSNLAKNLEKSGSITVGDLKAVEKINFSEGERSIVPKKIKPSTLSMPEGAEVSVMEETFDSLPNKLVVSADKTVAATEQAGEAGLKKIDAIASKDAAGVSKAEQEVKVAKQKEVVAKKEFETQDAQLQTTKAGKVAKAQEQEAASVTKAKEAAKSGDPEATAGAKQEALDAQDATQKAAADSAATKRLSAKQKYEQAQTDLKTANAERDAINEKLKTAKGPEADELKAQKGILDEDIVQKEAAVTTARDGWLDTTSEWEIGSRLKRRLGWGKDWTATTLKEKGLQLLGDTPLTLMNAVLFMLPSVGMSVWQEWIGKGSLIKTLKKAQKFGNIWMKIPDEFINDEQPSQSKFMYVGLDTEDRDLTSKYLKSANYYVSKPEFTSPGNEAISDANFPGKMLHLNTGFVFLGDGNAADGAKPAIPLLEPAMPGNSKEATLKSIVETLAQGMRGGSSSQSTRYAGLATESAGYDGSQLVANLFSAPKADEWVYPPIMQGAINALASGAKFGQFTLRAFKSLSKEAVDAVSASLGQPSIPLAKNNVPFVARGVYVYETQDTPFIKMVLNRIRPEDSNAALLHKELVDYVVLFSLDKEATPLPLEVPVPTLDRGHFATYALDPDAPTSFYMLSGLEDDAFYGFDGQRKQKPSGIAWPNLPGEVKDQINLVKKYVTEKLKYGPFLYGSVQLFIDENLANEGLFVYRIPNFLGDGIDDYVVGLERGKSGMQVTSLPNEKVQLFVSLVTSRFYDASFKPYTKKTPFWVVAQNSDLTKMRVTTKKPTASEQVIFPDFRKMGKNSVVAAPLYTLFIDQKINPNNSLLLTGGDKVPVVEGLTMLPVSSYWALENIQYNESITVDAALNANAADLVSKIKAAHEAWKESLDAKDPMAVSNAMGPFTFAESTQPIQFIATSEADIKNGNYVYTSDFYPDEFLVMSGNASGSEDFATEFVFGSPQRYAISLSSGNVYDAQKNGERVEQIKDVTSLTKRAQARTFLKTLADKIATSQKLYVGQMIKQLYGSDTAFGPFQLYINRNDFDNGQFIYADVTGLGSPLNADGSENAQTMAGVRDYFVCVAQRAQLGDDGKELRDKSGSRVMQSQFGVRMGSDVTQVISLVSGAVYDRGGVYLGSYQQFNFGDISASSPLENTTKVLDVISKNSGKSLRPAIQAIVTKLTKPEFELFLSEKKEIEVLRDKEAALYVPLDGNLKANIDAAKYIQENPSLPSRYLKFVGGKYYKAVPGDPETGAGALYLDYNRGSAGKDAELGALFEIKEVNGKLTQVVTPLKSWALTMARLAAGVIVERDGTQKLGIGFMHADLPIKTKEGLALIKTPIPAKMVNGVTTEFYYNTITDNFYAMIARGTKKVLVDLSSGFAYTPEGIPAMNENDVFVGPQENDFLLVGKDDYGLLKIVKHLPDANGDIDHDVYIQSGAALPDLNDSSVDLSDMKNYVTLSGVFNNHKAVMYDMVSEKNPAESIRLFNVLFDSVGRRLAQPYYVVSGADYKLVGPYKLSAAIRFASLAYLQTRPAGSDQYAGSFVESDYLDQSGKPKTVLILFDQQNQALKAVVFGDQLVELRGAAAVYTGSYQDQENKAIAITVKAQRDPASGGHWISISYGGKTYDYLFDSFVFDTLPQASCQEDSLNLYCLKNEWKLNVSSIVPNGGGSKALLSLLNPAMGAGTVKFPETISTGERDAVASNAAKIMLDPAGIVYQDGLGTAGLRVKRFVYQLSDDDALFDWYEPTMKGWYVDLSNGALYRPLALGAFPVGYSLLASQFAQLRDKIGLRVQINAKTGLPESLAYHGLVTDQQGASASQKVAVRRIQKPTMQRVARATGSKARGVNRSVQPITTASRNSLRV